MPADGWGVRDLRVVLAGRTVLDGVTLDVVPGRVAAVVGGDGAGKTTLLRTLTGRVRPASGRLRLPDAREVGYQSAGSGTWDHLTVDENLDLVAAGYRLTGAAQQERRERLLAAAGLVAARGRLAAELSGGMRHKLGVVMAMLHDPRLLVLDEPSTGVDPVSRVELWSLVAEAAAGGVAVVMATTYLDEAERVQHVLVLDAGTPLLQGTPDEVVADAPGTVCAVVAPTVPALAWRRGHAFRQWHDGGPGPGDQVVEPDMEDAVIAASLDRDPSRGAALGLPAPTRATSGVLVEARQLTKSFGGGDGGSDGSSNAVAEVSLVVRPGEVVGLIGANGAGKTTLIRMLLGLLEPTSGTALLLGAPPSRSGRERVGYVPQGLGLYRDLTVDENLAFSAAAYDVPDVAAAVGLAPLADTLVGDVGLGQARQTAFSAALAHAPDLLVLDEPTSGVDPIARARLWDTIHAQAEAGAGVLVSTHYMQEAAQCDRLVLMDLGRTVAEGTTADIVDGTRVVVVDTPQWGTAFDALRRDGLAVALAGRQVRVVDAAADEVAASLRRHGVTADVRAAAATLDERMTAIARSRLPVAT